MTTKNYTVILKRSNDVVSGNTKAPTSDDLQYGEIALNYHNGMEKLYMKNDIDDIVPFASEEEIERKIEITHITWNNLKSLRDNNELQPGKWYRIIDYNTTTTQEDTQSAEHQFDVLVLATDTNKLSEEARAIKHSGDTYFTNAGANLEGWKIWYCLDNDTNRFTWADTGTTGRGVIYRMIDEWGNDCPYDFKNVQFKRYKITASTKCPDLVNLYGINGSSIYTVDNNNPYWVYTFSMIDTDNDTLHDVTVEQNVYYSDEGYCYKNYNNVFKSYYYDDYDRDPVLELMSLPNNVFVTDTDICAIEEGYGEFYGFSNNTFGNDCGNNTFGNSCGSNTFGNGCNNNTFGNGCYSNTFGNDCGSNTFGNDCGNNTFENGCGGNTFGYNCGNNTFGKSCGSNTFGKSCGSNTFGTRYYHNTFGNYCNSNTFGNICASNTFGNDCECNTFGNSCNNNTFGNDCGDNTFGNGYEDNTFGKTCYGNTFGNICASNTFGNNCDKNTFGNGCNNIRVQKDYVHFIIVENGNKYIDITSTQTTSAANILRNFTISQGVNNTSTRKTISHNSVNDTFKTTYQNSNSTVVNV